VLAGRHTREFRRAVARGEWERTKDGILFPRQHALLRGQFTVASKHGRQTFPNALLFGAAADAPSSGYWGGFLANIFSPPTLLNSLYVAIFGNNVTPNFAWAEPYLLDVPPGQNGVDEWVLWNEMGELADPPEGYDEATRPAWVWADAGGYLLDNNASPAAFTMRTASTINVYGFAICAESQKHRGRPYNSGQFLAGPDLSKVWLASPPCVTAVDVAHYVFPEVYSNYAPLDAVILGPSVDDLYGYGRSFRVDPLAHPGDPGEFPLLLDTGVGPSGTQTQVWYDPSGDDYYDTGLGHWVDPSGDDILPHIGTTQPMFAAARMTGAPLVFNDLDPLNVTYGLQLTAT
jgi:hypothetical protein